jgi:hypothetical protein
MPPAYPPGSGAPPPAGYGYAGYVAPPPDPTVHNHDGFYLRIGIGGAYLHDGISYDYGGPSDVSAPGNFTVSGGALAGEFLLGGTVAPGFVLGGGTMGVTAIKPKLEINGTQQSASNNVTLSTLGILADWYVNAHRGFHFGALVGVSQLGAANSHGETIGNAARGPGFALLVGNEWWVGEQWGIGVEGRLQLAPLRYAGSDYTEKDMVVVPALLFTATMH